MIIAVHGNKNFDDYSIFLNGMWRALNDFQEGIDNEIFIYTAGPKNINEFAHEYANVSERGLKGRGVKIQVRRVPPSWIKDNFNFLDHVAYFGVKKEDTPEIINSARAKDVRAEVYRY